MEYEQGGQTRAAYGQSLITNLSRDLRLRNGKGFSRSNVIRARQFYLAYPKGATLSHLLSWSHVVELLKLDDPLERSFYEQQCAREKWAVRELQRQIKSSLFLRLAAEENGEGDNPPIGIILTRHRDELLVEYATYKMDSQLFVQKYQLYLPDREELRGQLEAALQEAAGEK